MPDYPVPSYAANIWVTGNTLWLSFPPTVAEGHSHSVPFPCTEKGLSLAISVLHEREKGCLKISNKSAPTRYQVERALANDRRYNEILRALNAPKVDPEVEALMKEIGL